MRLIVYEGVEHRLSERNWKKMLRRFDARKAKMSPFGYFEIHVNSICVDRSYKCIRCPLRDPHKTTNSCTYLFRRIIGEELFQYVYLFDSAVMWEPKYDSEARQALQKVRHVLSGAEYYRLR